MVLPATPAGTRAVQTTDRPSAHEKDVHHCHHRRRLTPRTKHTYEASHFVEAHTKPPSDEGNDSPAQTSMASSARRQALFAPCVKRSAKEASSSVATEKRLLFYTSTRTQSVLVQVVAHRNIRAVPGWCDRDRAGLQQLCKKGDHSH